MELTKSIFLAPEDLNKNIHETIFKKIKESFEGHIGKEDGHILKVYSKGVVILDNFVSASKSSDIVFRVRFKADILKPEIGSVYEGNIIIAEERGIFVSILGKMNVLVPCMRLTDNYVFEKGKSAWCSKTQQKQEYKVGDKAKVEVVNVRFDSKFNCIGVLKDE